MLLLHGLADVDSHRALLPLQYYEESVTYGCDEEGNEYAHVEQTAYQEDEDGNVVAAETAEATAVQDDEGNVAWEASAEEYCE